MLRQPQLETRSGVPLYRQVYEHIKEAIQTGHLSEGDRLPATRELAGQLGLNRTTITAAYGLLESNGLIHRHVGRGSFVSLQTSELLPELRWRELLPELGTVAPVPAPLRDPASAISFATSRPSEDLFPMSAIRTAAAQVLASAEASEILQLGSPAGYPPLRSHLMKAARAEHVARPNDDLVVTSGCQQALDLLGRVLVGKGDTVLVEDPVYPGIHHVLARAGARVIGVPVGPDGMEVDRLERELVRARPKAVVLTPNFQNPTGATLPLPARHAIVRLVKSAGAVLIESDIYGELRYQGSALPTLKQLDPSGDVVQLRSFSKVAFPGLRVGWVIGPRELIARLVEAKQWSDLHTDQLAQALMLRFAESGSLSAHQKRMVVAGAERLAAALSACERSLPRGTRYTRPEGGMSLWVDLPERLDAGELLARAHAENVSYLPGKYFSVSNPHNGALRLSFAGLVPEKIREGIAILGEVFRSELERARKIARQEPAQAMV